MQYLCTLRAYLTWKKIRWVVGLAAFWVFDKVAGKMFDKFFPDSFSDSIVAAARPVLGYGFAIIRVLVSLAVAWILYRQIRDDLKGSRLRINPHWEEDQMWLDGTWHLSARLGSKTVLIVIGNITTAEILDRPMAALIRNTIDRRGKGKPQKRAIIVTHAALNPDPATGGDPIEENRKLVAQCPKIYVGGTWTNPGSAELLDRAHKQGKNESEVGTGAVVIMNDRGMAEAAIWGPDAKDCLSAIRGFINGPKLEEFLDLSWNQRPVQAPQGPTLAKSPKPATVIASPLPVALAVDPKIPKPPAPRLGK